jgi:hypothetical protein
VQIGTARGRYASLPETKLGITPFSSSRFGEETRRNPQLRAVSSYFDRLKLGVNRGRMNSCAMAANARSASLTLKATNTSPVPRFEWG